MSPKTSVLVTRFCPPMLPARRSVFAAESFPSPPLIPLLLFLTAPSSLPEVVFLVLPIGASSSATVSEFHQQSFAGHATGASAICLMF